jgi:hypothetical protein
MLTSFAVFGCWAVVLITLRHGRDDGRAAVVICVVLFAAVCVIHVRAARRRNVPVEHLWIREFSASRTFEVAAERLFSAAQQAARQVLRDTRVDRSTMTVTGHGSDRIVRPRAVIGVEKDGASGSRLTVSVKRPGVLVIDYGTCWATGARIVEEVEKLAAKP